MLINVLITSSKTSVGIEVSNITIMIDKKLKSFGNLYR